MNRQSNGILVKLGNNFTRHHLITHTNKLKLFSHQMISKNSGSVLFCYLDFEIVSCVCCNGTLGVRNFSWTCRPATDPEASPPRSVSAREKKPLVPRVLRHMTTRAII